MNESDPLPDDTEPLSEFDLFPIVPPLNGSFTEPHTVVTVTWPDESQSHWIECPLCHATPTTVTRFEDSVVYDFDYFGRVTVPVTEYGFMEEWLGFHKEATDDEWCVALRLYREAGVHVYYDAHACPLED